MVIFVEIIFVKEILMKVSEYCKEMLFKYKVNLLVKVNVIEGLFF